MAIIIGYVSQKGGAGKSTLARALARELVVAGQRVLIADLDDQQQTSFKWSERRAENAIDPLIDVTCFTSVADALEAEEGVDVLILDGPARASQGTLEIAEAAQLVVQPCGPTKDDMDPAMVVFHKLVANKIDPKKLAFALFRTSSKSQETKARAYLSTEFDHPSGDGKLQYHVLEGALTNKPGYAQALDDGLTVTETKWESLNDDAAELIKDMVQWMILVNKKKAA